MKKQFLSHLAKKLNAVEELKESYTHEHNFALSILKQLGDVARDILELRKRMEKLEKRKCA